MEICSNLIVTDLLTLKDFPSMLRAIVKDVNLDVVRHIVGDKSNSDRIVSTWCYTVESKIHHR